MNDKSTVDLTSMDTVKASNAGAAIEIMHPTTGEPIGLKIVVLGRDSDEFKRVTTLQSRRRFSKMTKTGVLKVDAVPQSEIEADELDALASCTRAFLDADDKPTEIKIGDTEYPFTKENAVKVYSKMPWLREQVDKGIGDRSNFLK